MNDTAPDSFELHDHDADVAIVGEAGTRAGALVQAARGLTACITDPAAVRPAAARRVVAEGTGAGDVLVNWLRALLDLYNAEGFLGSEFTLAEYSDTRAAGEARGEALVPGRHAVLHEVKGVTWHAAVLHEKGGRWFARVIVDV